LLEYSVVLKEQYRRLWLSENRPMWLPNVMALWDRHVDFWTDQIHKFSRLRNDYNEGEPLPPPESVGLIEELAEAGR
jgi:hypothetical protein